MNIERVPLTSELTLYPCPVTLVTCSHKHRRNIITVSWAGIACSKPESVTIAVKPSRYSYNIIEESREFCINVPTTQHVREADMCGSTSGRDVDKFALCGFHTIASECIDAPQIAECPVSLECSVTEVIRLGGHHLFIAKVLHKSISGGHLLSTGGVALKALDPIVYIRPYYYSLTGNMLGKHGYSRVEGV